MRLPAVLECVAIVAALVVALPHVQAFVEAVTARRKGPGQAPGAGPVRVSIVVPAYLPNEELTLLDTVTACLARTAADDAELVVAYNTPGRHPLEDELRSLADRDPRLVPLRVAGSRSKAANVNAAAQIVRHEVVAIFDADAVPDVDAIRVGVRAIEAGADVVQGASLVRADVTSALASVTRGEQAVKHFVSYAARQSRCSVAYFAGSNGYWRSDVLRAHPLDRAHFTEDIDASLRAQLAGAVVVHDPSTVARELPPPDVAAWVRQRRRWAAGWRQLVADPRLRPAALAVGPRAWLAWAWLLRVRRIAAPLALLVLVLIAPSARLTAIAFGTAVLVVPWVVAAVQVMALRRVAPQAARTADLVSYAVARPLIEVVTLALAALALIAPPASWVVTPRAGHRVGPRLPSAT